MDANRPADVTRVHLTALVAACPGASAARLARVLGLSASACLHHLRVLAKAGRVVKRSELHDTRRGWYAPGSRAHATQWLLDADTRRLAESVLDAPGQTQRAHADLLGLHGSPVHRRAVLLERGGWITRLSSGGALELYPTPRLEALLVARRDADACAGLPLASAHVLQPDVPAVEA
jgi:DNA-binding Lrp family transcriptional regulator